MLGLVRRDAAELERHGVAPPDHGNVTTLKLKIEFRARSPTPAVTSGWEGIQVDGHDPPSMYLEYADQSRNREGLWWLGLL